MGRGGEESLSPRAQQDIRSDQRFQPFLSDSFNAAKFASNALENTQTTPQAQIDYLQQGIAILDTQLRNLVLQHREELVKHTSNLDEADTSLQRISLSVRSLQSVAARVRAEVMEPYQQIVTRTQQLSNVQRTVDLLRQTIHRVKLVQRLRAEMSSGATDIMQTAKAARLLSDIRVLETEVDLSGLTPVDNDTEFIETTYNTVRSHIKSSLRNGLDTLSQADVGSALQALYNLQELQPAVYDHIDSVVSTLEKTFFAAMDSRKLSASTSGATASSTGSTGVRSVVAGALQGATARVQEVMWEKISEACDGVWRSGVAMWHLQRVLQKKRDPLTHDLFIDCMLEKTNGRLPLDTFWEKLSSALSQAFATSFSVQRGGIVRDALVQQYPRLAALLESACARIIKDTSSARDVVVALNPQQATALLSVPRDAENSYLASVNVRLQNAAVAAFSGGSRALPTAADLQTLVARIHEEIKIVTSGEGDRLATLVATVAGAALSTAADKAEVMAAVGPDVRTIGATCNQSQARNISLCNALQEIHRSVAVLAPRLPPTAAAAFVGPVDLIQATALDLVIPLFRSMADSVQDRIMKIHSLNLAADKGAEGTVVETSTIIKDIVEQLTKYRIEYLSKFTPSPSTASPSSVSRALVERLASRVITFFIRHAALVRPLSQGGKLQLAKDISELEAGITQQLVTADQIGAPLLALRAFRRLLFTDTNEMMELVRAKKFDDVSVIDVLHHLFSRAPTALESPHVRNKLSLSQYSVWLDQHGEEDAVRSVKAAVDAGLSKVRGQSEEEKCKVIVEVMESFMARVP